MNNYYDSFGLINAHPDEINGENAILYTYEHYLMTKSNADFAFLKSAINICRIEPGIFLQNPSNFYAEGDDMYMSHDQATTIMLFSWQHNLPYHTEMWKEIKRQWFMYDNINPPRSIAERLKNRRFIHPRDIIFYGNLCGCILWKLLLPVLWLFMLFSALSKWKIRDGKKLPALSGKCLNFIRLKALKKVSLAWKIQWIIHTKLMNRDWGGWRGVFALYFPFSDHPCVVDFKE